MTKNQNTRIPLHQWSLAERYLRAAEKHPLGERGFATTLYSNLIYKLTEAFFRYVGWLVAIGGLQTVFRITGNRVFHTLFVVAWTLFYLHLAGRMQTFAGLIFTIFTERESKTLFSITIVWSLMVAFAMFWWGRPLLDHSVDAVLRLQGAH